MKLDNLNDDHHNIMSFADRMFMAGGLHKEEGMNMIDFESTTLDSQMSKNVGKLCMNRNNSIAATTTNTYVETASEHSDSNCKLRPDSSVEGVQRPDSSAAGVQFGNDDIGGSGFCGCVNIESLLGLRYGSSFAPPKQGHDGSWILKLRVNLPVPFDNFHIRQNCPRWLRRYCKPLDSRCSMLRWRLLLSDNHP
ncbi:hypothetical protein L6452_39081 [Arctium lappa]|uniref:Uncharacterized protein n=1 Tax=Arctium lappa TaxID=4217 RepID=A0ACB8XS17_ARCLA|nr:hypothetical protein L6452_39081 [Arctium lappa]